MFSYPQMVQQKPAPPPPTFTQSLTPSSLHSCLLAYWRDNGCKLMKPLRALVTQGRVGTQPLHHPQTLINQARSSLRPSLWTAPAQSQCVCSGSVPRLPPLCPHSSNVSAGLPPHHWGSSVRPWGGIPASHSFALLLVFKTGIQSQRRRRPSKVDVHLINLASEVFPIMTYSPCLLMQGGVFSSKSQHRFMSK